MSTVYRGAGSLDRRVTVQTATTASDGRGGQTTTWVDGDTIPVAIEPLAGRESLQVQAMQHAMAHRVTLRYRATVTVAQRLYWIDRALAMEIVSLRELGRRQWLELECVEVDS